MLGWAHSSLGHPEEARSYRREAQALEKEHGGRLLASDWFTALEAELALQAGDPERSPWPSGSLRDFAKKISRWPLRSLKLQVARM